MAKHTSSSSASKGVGGKNGNSSNGNGKKSATTTTNGAGAGSTKNAVAMAGRGGRTTTSMSIPVCITIATLSFLFGLALPPFLELYGDRIPQGQELKSMLQLIHSSSSREGYGNDRKEQSRRPRREMMEASSSADEDDAVILTRQRMECTPETLKHYLHDKPVQGLHLFCVKEGRSPEEGGVPVGGLTVTVYKHSCCQDTDSGEITSKPVSHAIDGKWASLRDIIVDTLGPRETSLQLTNSEGVSLRSKWTVYSPHGEVLADAITNNPKKTRKYLTNVYESGLVIVQSGGTWIWPGVKVGYERHISLKGPFLPPPLAGDSGDSNGTATTTTIAFNPTVATLRTLSLSPLVLAVENFLSTKECEYIQEVATPTMAYSGVSLMDKDKGKDASEWRTSQNTFVSASGHEKLKEIDRRVSMVTRIPVVHQEHVQVLRYGHGQRYDHHTDYFDPKFYKEDKNTLELTKDGIRNRLATVFWYLSDVEEGGETNFPAEGGKYRKENCQTGLLVKPEKGKVIIFYSMLPDGSLDPYSSHGACPVKEGVKWAANKWVWNEPMQFVDPTE